MNTIVRIFYLSLFLLNGLLSRSATFASDGDATKGLFGFFAQRIEASALVESELAFGIGLDNKQKFEIMFKPELEIELPFGLDFTAIGRIRSEAFDKLEPVTIHQNEVSPVSRRAFVGDRTDFELREFYIEGTIGRTFLTLGKQQIVWGKADGLKVLDLVNPQDFREFILDDFDDSRIPLWAVNAEIPIAEAVVQLIWIPEQTYHDLPEPESPYAFTAPRFRPAPPPDVAVELRPVERPGNFFTDSDFGVRLSTFWQGWDLTLNYLYHYYDIPVLFQELLILSGESQITVTPRYKRSHLVGGTFSNAFGSLTVRGELGYSFDRFHLTESLPVSNGVAKTDEFAYVLGFDWFGISETFLSVQIFQDWVTDDKPGLIRNRVDTNTSLLLQREFMNDRWMTEVLWLQNFNEGDGLIRPKASYEFLSNVKLWAGFDIFYGSNKGLFGQFDGNDRIVLGMEWGL